MFKILVVTLILLPLLNCGSNGSNPAKGSGGELLASYELEGGCSTGTQTFKANSEAELTSAFCEGLKDNSRNNNCAADQRQQTFSEMRCPGTWPYQTPGGFSSIASKMYSFQENSCSTGLHVFASADGRTTLRMYCKALKNDDFNRGCARGSRDDAFNKDNCISVQ